MILLFPGNVVRSVSRFEIPSLVELQEQHKDDPVVLGSSVRTTPRRSCRHTRPEPQEMNYLVLVGNGREDVQEAFDRLRSRSR